MRDRIVAWVVFGPPGHLAGGALDWFTLLARYWWSRLGRDGAR